MRIQDMNGVVSTAGMTPAEKQAAKDNIMARVRNGISQMMQERENELDTPTSTDQIWVVYIDSQDREGASVFYCWTTMAKSRVEAIDKVSNHPDCQYDPDELDAECPTFVE